MKKAGLLPKKAALYLRVSTRRQASDSISLDAQELPDSNYAPENGFTVDAAHVYREAHTGGELFERPALMALLDAARRGEFQVVVVDCMDRWVRDDAAGGWLDIELRRAGVELHF